MWGAVDQQTWCFFIVFLPSKTYGIQQVLMGFHGVSWSLPFGWHSSEVTVCFGDVWRVSRKTVSQKLTIKMGFKAVQWSLTVSLQWRNWLNNKRKLRSTSHSWRFNPLVFFKNQNWRFNPHKSWFVDKCGFCNHLSFVVKKRDEHVLTCIFFGYTIIYICRTMNNYKKGIIWTQINKQHLSKVVHDFQYHPVSKVAWSSP